MNLLRPPLVLQAHAGGRELGGPGRRWGPLPGPRSRTPSYCSASQPDAASNSDPPMMSSRTRMTQSPGVPLLQDVAPPENMVCSQLSSLLCDSFPFGHSWGGIQGPLCVKLRRDRTPQSVQEGCWEQRRRLFLGNTQLVCSVLAGGLPSEPWLEEALGTDVGADG